MRHHHRTQRLSYIVDEFSSATVYRGTVADDDRASEGRQADYPAANA